MDWDRYRSYVNVNGTSGTILECGCYNSINPTFTGTTFDDALDGVVADVTDSYKELSSERIRK